MSAVTPARRAAYETLRRTFEHGAWTDRAFPAAAKRHGLEGRERAQAQRLAYGSVQRRGSADHVIERLTGRPLERLDPPVVAALRLAVFELLYSRATAAHATVDQAVELAKSGLARERAGGRRRAKAAGGLVNGVLRRAARERARLFDDVDDSTADGAATLLSYPRWLARMWWDELGPDAARSLMAAMNEPMETALRANPLMVEPEALAQRLRDGGQETAAPSAASPLSAPEALILQGGLAEATRKALEAGEAVMQSRGSQAVIELLDPRAGERVLDLCAAPGVKASGIAARLGNRGRVVAVELDRDRADITRELCERLAATCVEVVEGDARSDDLGGGYDRVLVDAPCSNLGTLASRPDARWRKSPELIGRLATLQAQILEHAARCIRPGGTLVYSTCTISRREGEERVSALASGTPGLSVDDLGADHPGLASSHDRRFLQIRPDRDATDGFFIARLRSAAGGG